MKKPSLVLTLAALACTAAFAQAPAGVVATPSAQASPTTSGGTPAAKAELKVDTRKANGSTLSAPDPVAGTGGAAASAQVNPSASGGTPAAKADIKVDSKKANGSTLSAQNPVAGSGGAAASAQVNPSAAGGTPAAKADMKVDAKLNNTAMNSMDTNGDGMVSKREWDRHHASMWGNMKTKSKNGMVPMSDVEMMMGTPK